MKIWIVYALVSMTFAGATAVVAKLGLEGISGELGLAVRTAFVCVFVLAFAAASVPRSELQTLDWVNVKWLAVSALTTAASWVFYYKAIKLGEVSTVAVIDNCSFLVAVVLAWLVLREPMSGRVAVGSLLVLVGLFIVAQNLRLRFANHPRECDKVRGQTGGSPSLDPSHPMCGFWIFRAKAVYCRGRRIAITEVATMISLKVNGHEQSVDVPPEMPLLWVLRESLGLTGTKFGCGMALCGACTVHLDGEAVRSCVTPVSRAAGKSITTIEGLSDDLSSPLQQAWIAEEVPQCGYCQSGQLMAAAVLLRENPHPTDTDIDDCMAGNICRCGTYQRIRKAIHRAAEMKAGGGAP